MQAKIFDLNCDMGEGFGNYRIADDENILPLITTANLACGFHGGDPVIMLDIARAALANHVAIGAHPGLPDRLGFGRRVMDVSPNEIFAFLVYQIGALQGFLRAAGAELNHVKPHGAMFHLLRQRDLADAALDAMIAVAPGAALYWPGPFGREPMTVLAAERGLIVHAEAYPDLDYDDAGSLIVERRKRPVDPALAYARMTEILRDGTLTNRNGVKLPMRVRTACIHSDGPNAIELLMACRRAIADCGWTLQTLGRNPGEHR